MKQILGLVFFLSFFISTYGQELHYNSDITNIIIDYDRSCMQKFEYKTDEEYIVEDNYINYHMKIDDVRTFILKLRASNDPISISEKEMKNHYELHCHSAADAVDEKFIYRVNHGGANIYLKLHTQEGEKIYKADYAILREMNKDHLSYYAPPYFAFKYRYDTEHNPGEPIPMDAYHTIDYSDANLFDVRYYLHGMTFQNEIRKDIFLKMYNDACHGREYGVTTPLSPYGEINSYLKSETDIAGKKILFRSCQHPIVTEVIKGVGLYKEYYQELDKTYMSKLVSIDGIDVEEYLELTAASLKEEEEYKQQEEVTYYASRGVSKERERDAAGNFIEPLNIAQQAQKDAPAIVVPKGSQPKKIKTDNYVVGTGDTLYNISKRHNTSVDRLKKLNNLTSNLILIGQELKVPKK